MSRNNSAMFGSNEGEGRWGREREGEGEKQGKEEETEGGTEGWREGEGVLIVFDDLFVGWPCQV